MFLFVVALIVDYILLIYCTTLDIVSGAFITHFSLANTVTHLACPTKTFSEAIVTPLSQLDLMTFKLISLEKFSFKSFLSQRPHNKTHFECLP